MLPLKQPVAASGEDGRFLSVPGGKIWHRRAGADGVPLIVVHGGPGFPHDYLLTLEAISKARPVIFYDQLGCGRSTAGVGSHQWTVERFTEELRVLISEYGRGGVHLLGHSWGSIPAFECTLKYPESIRSVIFASPSLSIPLWLADSRRLRGHLSVEMKAVLDRAERGESYDAFVYEAAVGEYYKRFVYGSHRYDELLAKAAAGRGREVYETMWGPNELFANGTLRDYDASPRLSALSLPVLFTCGRWDEASPEMCNTLRQQIPGAQLKVFELSAHHPHLSEPVEYCAAINEFVSEAEG